LDFKFVTVPVGEVVSPVFVGVVVVVVVVLPVVFVWEFELLPNTSANPIPIPMPGLLISKGDFLADKQLIKMRTVKMEKIFHCRLPIS
jgi:hypothetical protein